MREAPAPAASPRAVSPLQRRLASAIVAHARRENLGAGARLPEEKLAALLGTSRSPVRTTLVYLAKVGVASKHPRRGWILARAATALDRFELPVPAEDRLYDAIVAWRLDGSAPDAVNESEVMRRFAVSRHAARHTLQRIQHEGWAERRTGRGWSFLPLVDSTAAYEECYAFRIAIEPAAILIPGYFPVRTEMARLRELQERIAGEGHRTMTPAELFEANSGFHETLVAWSGNRFMLQAVRRINRLRRLVEYRHVASDRGARGMHAREHLAILGLIEQGDLLGAAAALRTHLDAGRKLKTLRTEAPRPQTPARRPPPRHPS